LYIQDLLYSWLGTEGKQRKTLSHTRIQTLTKDPTYREEPLKRFFSHNPQHTNNLVHKHKGTNTMDHRLQPPGTMTIKVNVSKNTSPVEAEQRILRLVEAVKDSIYDGLADKERYNTRNLFDLPVNVELTINL